MPFRILMGGTNNTSAEQVATNAWGVSVVRIPIWLLGDSTRFTTGCQNEKVWWSDLHDVERGEQQPNDLGVP